eukprot:513281-Pyramimonas_sp.AAC.1
MLVGYAGGLFLPAGPQPVSREPFRTGAGGRCPLRAGNHVRNPIIIKKTCFTGGTKLTATKQEFSKALSSPPAPDTTGTPTCRTLAEPSLLRPPLDPL